MNTDDRVTLLQAAADGIDGFTSAIIDIGDQGMHCVRGGSGPPLILLHGFPQDWFEWRAVLPRLAEAFTVVAVDLRGAGLSDAPQTGYSAAQLATDVHALVHHLELGPAHIAGHDIGGWVAYAYARQFPRDTTRVTIIETLIPGTARFAEPELDVALWHGEFHMVPGLAETLIVDRQEPYFRYFFDIGTRADEVISDAHLQHYVAAYGNLPHLRAAFETYRAVPQNISDNQNWRGSIDIPLTLVGGEHVFGPALPDTADELRAGFGWTDVEMRIIPNGQHYVVEEQPDDVIGLLTP
jgi:pimeloyl-ACP methyl ester carboxylesterase